MDEMVLLPAAGLEEEQTEAVRNPWLERREHGFFSGLFRTIWMALIRPKELASMTRAAEHRGNEAWKFAILVNMLVALVGVAQIFLLSAGMGLMFGGGPGVLGWFVIVGIIAVVMLLASVVGTALWILIWGGVTHLLLNRAARNLRKTYQALCYGTGANAATAVPCLGFHFGWIWWLVSAVVMVKELHKVSGGRAALAVLTLPVASILVVVGLYAAMMYYAMSAAAAGGAFAGFGGMATAQAQVVVSGLDSYVMRNGAYPSHAIELVSEVDIMPSNLQSILFATALNKVPVADTNLAVFDKLSKPQQDSIVRAAIAALPVGTIAHRLGDCVFTYHGIDPKSADPGLWVVIVSPDPAQNPSPAATSFLVVGRADGTAVSLPINRFAKALAEQNDLRAQHGLAPLPDPSKVTHAKPAVATVVDSRKPQMKDG